MDFSIESFQQFSPSYSASNSNSDESPGASAEAGPSTPMVFGVIAASTSQAPPAAAPKPAKKAKRRACDACRLRQVRCDRAPGQDDCIKCSKMGIKCVESAPKARTSNKGARIAQAKALYGDENGASAAAYQTALTTRNTEPAERMNSSLVYGNRVPMELLDNMRDAALVDKLVSIGAKLKITSYPLLRWLDVAGELQAEGSVSRMDPISQALYLSYAAMISRMISPQDLDGQESPSLVDLSTSEQLRQGTALCKYGERREKISMRLLEAAKQKIDNSSAFAKPSLRSVTALSLAEMLLSISTNPLRMDPEGAMAARPYGSAAASHLRILVEEYSAGGCEKDYSFFSVAWTCILRDTLIASATGRALYFTQNDLHVILNIDDSREIPIPDAQNIVTGWLQNKTEGANLMQVWAAALRHGRIFVNQVSQPVAVSGPLLDLDIFEPMYRCLAAGRAVLTECEALAAQIQMQRPIPEQVTNFRICADFFVAQAHRLVVWRSESDQLARASLALGQTNGKSAEYRARLHLLRLRSEEETFQAARRATQLIREVFSKNPLDAAEYFWPGAFVLEGVLTWIALLIDTKCAEENGRHDFTLADQLADLSVLREALAMSGWTSDNVRSHIEAVSQAIVDLERRHAKASAIVESDNQFMHFLSQSTSPSDPSPEPCAGNAIPSSSISAIPNNVHSDTMPFLDIASPNWLNDFLKQHGMQV